MWLWKKLILKTDEAKATQIFDDLLLLTAHTEYRHNTLHEIQICVLGLIQAKPCMERPAK
jgi:hypothetical protein